FKVVLFIFISLICATSPALSVGGLHSCFLWVRASRESLGIGSTFSGVNDLGTTLTEAPLSLIRTQKQKTAGISSDFFTFDFRRERQSHQTRFELSNLKNYSMRQKALTLCDTRK
ncbi:MAG: hypothetical protein K0U50_07070, partial [Alphaproteobacteria bacterium]|nr:hypothetical protein [Alphaproteobacteria bacterium]